MNPRAGTDVDSGAVAIMDLRAELGKYSGTEDGETPSPEAGIDLRTPGGTRHFTIPPRDSRDSGSGSDSGSFGGIWYSAGTGSGGTAACDKGPGTAAAIRISMRAAATSTTTGGDLDPRWGTVGSGRLQQTMDPGPKQLVVTGTRQLVNTGPRKLVLVGPRHFAGTGPRWLTRAGTRWLDKVGARRFHGAGTRWFNKAGTR